ncbi:hypothetical protein Ae201684P_010753 [Aphanomyces euteiches]|nr:hypothetical protein Ae201684P_010753 [Aphanomyces euteiches]
MLSSMEPIPEETAEDTWLVPQPAPHIPPPSSRVYDSLQCFLAVAFTIAAILTIAGAAWLVHASQDNHAAEIVSLLAQTPGLPSAPPRILVNYKTRSSHRQRMRSSSPCPSDSFPSLVAAHVVHDGDLQQALDCAGGTLLALDFADEPYIVCKEKKSPRLTRGVGQDLYFVVEYILNSQDLPADILAAQDEAMAACPEMLLPMPPPLPSVWMPSHDDILNQVDRLPPQVSSLDHQLRRHHEITRKQSCTCKLDRKRPCLFVNGVGYNATLPPRSSYPETWGSIHEHAPCCTSTSFGIMETIQRGWQNASLQGEFCDLVDKTRDKDDGLILITHSMANLVAASAFASGVCSIIDDLVWVSLSGPNHGTKAANLLEKTCKEGGWPRDVLAPILDAVGSCPAQPAYLSVKLESTASPAMVEKFKAAQDVLHRHVNRTMCGVSPFGLATTVSVALDTFAKLAHHDSAANDGLVDFPSCVAGVGDVNFGTDAVTAVNYRAQLNHLDTTFRFGDGWWGNDRKPVKWFECTL